MTPFKYHVYVCAQKKMEGVTACSAAGARETLAALRDEIAALGLETDARVNTCGCLGVCGKGPNLVVYPDGAWYSGVGPEEAREIAREHLKNGQPVERLLNRDAAALKQVLVGICGRPDGKELCKSLTLKAVKAASDKDYRALVKRYNG